MPQNPPLRPVPVGLRKAAALPLLLAGALAALAITLFAVPAEAQTPPRVEAFQAECLPETDNGLLEGRVQPEVGGAEVRAYFRWDARGEFYYVVMRPEGGGNYWGVPPKPIETNEMVEYYIDVVEPSGRSLARSATLEAPVEDDCRVSLTPQQAGEAENLVVGETAQTQINERILGFLCDGVISRIGPDGILRADSVCRRCIVAWWQKKEILIPAAGLLTTGLVVEDREASPARP